MDNKKSPSKKLMSIEEEKFTREVDLHPTPRNYTRTRGNQLLLDLEILKKHPTQRQASQRVLVSIKPRTPAIKTIYIAEKKRFQSRKGSEKSGSLSRLGTGDYSSYTTHFNEDDSNISIDQQDTKDRIELEEDSRTDEDGITSSQYDTSSDSKCPEIESHQRATVFNVKRKSAEKCYVYTQPPVNMNLPRVETKAKEPKESAHKVDIGTFVAYPTSEDFNELSINTLYKLTKRIDHLERKILRQEMVFRSIDPNIYLSSSDEECRHPKMKPVSGSERPGCSYIQQYSHIPETSAFQRYAQHSSSLSPNKATLEKEHNSEQYGRDFTAYDGITARGRRQCASVPCKRDDFPKMAAERVHKIRNKLNPVRDYRLMDTVHYLAQGEFAPRDDGIKLTPSREGVLSDIIYEDVCRTHWPNTRLGRRPAQPERCSTRYELQRLIDSLLRERVAHVERRKRRHYRIVKLNHRHESCRPMGKTGDIIVASHKKKESSEERPAHISDHNAASAMMSSRRWEEQATRRNHRSHDRLTYEESCQKRRFRQEECSPGPSYAACRSPASREPTCCYQTSSPTKRENNTGAIPKCILGNGAQELTSTSSSSCKRHSKKPRLVVKKEAAHRKYKKEEPDLEQYVLLPTLVIRTPSNVRRQKKFNELYHRILNVQLNNPGNAVKPEAEERKPNLNSNKKDIGFNINITLSRSEEKIHNKLQK